MSFLAHKENGLFIRDQHRPAGVRHGFSNPHGGVSPAPWDSPEPGGGPGDDMDRVRENYRRFCAALVGRHRAVLSKQVHEDNVRLVTAEDCGKGLFRERDYTSVDAMITDTPDPLVVFPPPTAGSSCCTTRCAGPWAGPRRMAKKLPPAAPYIRPSADAELLARTHGTCGPLLGGHRPLLFRNGR